MQLQLPQLPQDFIGDIATFRLDIQVKSQFSYLLVYIFSEFSVFHFSLTSIKSIPDNSCTSSPCLNNSFVVLLYWICVNNTLKSLNGIGLRENFHFFTLVPFQRNSLVFKALPSNGRFTACMGAHFPVVDWIRQSGLAMCLCRFKGVRFPVAPFQIALLV